MRKEKQGENTMEKVVAATAHFEYRCGTCQTALHLGPLACISKGSFIFYEIDDSNVIEQPYGLLCAIFPSKMKVRCAKCRATLGYSGRGLSYMDRAKYCYKLKSEALDVVVDEVGKDETEEKGVKESPKEAATVSPEAAAKAAKNEEMSGVLPRSMSWTKKKRLCLKCLKDGHSKYSCKEVPRCFCCGFFGHLATNCPKLI